MYYVGCRLAQPGEITTEPSACGSDAAFLSNYFDYLSFLVLSVIFSVLVPCGKLSQRSVGFSAHTEQLTSAPPALF